MRYGSRRDGMVLLLVIGCLIFTSIIFAGMVKRVRYESALTARNSVNEMMYQIASSIGRITMRKLAKDFSNMDQTVEDKLIDAIFQGKTFKDKDYTKTIQNLDVVKELLARKEYQHTRGNLTIKEVICSADFETKSFNPDIPGLAVKNDFEKRGNIVVNVTVSYSGYVKKCMIKKPFFVVRLLPAPFFKFTLFSRNGAKLPQTSVNRMQNVADDGKTTDRDPPLVLFNRLLDNKAKGVQGLDFVTVNGSQVFLKNSQELEESGWVYLGGDGSSTDLAGKTGNLTLNAMAGGLDPMEQGYFGECFHYYFTNDSFGWLCADDYTTFVNSQNGSDKTVSIAYNDFGFFTGQKTAQFNKQKLFEAIYSDYKLVQANEVFDKGSALHLFGTPTLCTPTLVFGKVKRRFLRTFGFLFGHPSPPQTPTFNRVYPLRIMSQTDWDSGFFPSELLPWVQDKTKNLGPANPVEMAITNAMMNVLGAPTGPGPLDYNGYIKGPQNFPRIAPQFVDTEPYLMGLKNIREPTAPQLPWTSVFSGFKYLDQKPDALFDLDYSFSADPEIDYTGKISDIYPRLNYLRDKVSYEISDSTLPKPILLSKVPFLTQGSDAILDLSQTPNILGLNQIIAIDGDLVIDQPMVVAKGGIILVNGEITINAPIINPYIHNYPNPPPNPNPYGYLTLVSEKGIKVNLPAATGGKPPELHAFLMAMNSGGDCRIETTNPFHLVGGLAADNIEDLVKKGGIIEWGFERGNSLGISVAKGAYASQQCFYGLAMGPRDIEVVTED